MTKPAESVAATADLMESFARSKRAVLMRRGSQLGHLLRSLAEVNRQTLR